jgi:hypothetical protein
MCEILVYAIGAVDQLHPMRYRAGDVVVVKPDGAVWGRDELKPNSSFRVLVFPGVDSSEVEHLLLEGVKEIPDASATVPPGHPLKMIGRRRDHHFDLTHQSLHKKWLVSDGSEKITVDDVSPHDLVTIHPPIK